MKVAPKRGIFQIRVHAGKRAGHRVTSDVQFHHVFVVQHVLAADRLAVVNAAAPDAGRLQLVGEIAVDTAAISTTVLPIGQVNGEVMSGGLPGCLV